ncbi:MAG: hypothetical protein CMK55_04940 [Proteobacteria bacterium]|nr:hypothetical protein [Pseudomonadota bacterium]
MLKTIPMLLKTLGIIFLNLSFNIVFANESDSIKCFDGFSFENNSKSCVKFLTNENERKKGLMFQKRLEPNHELHFLWNDSKYRCMWMKNTSISIDILFIDGKQNLILEEGKPFSKKKICHEAKIVVEANKGELAKKYALLYE